MAISDLSKLSDEDMSNFLDSFDTVLTDLDGVLWVLGSPLEGARDAVAALEAMGKRFFYVTNNATTTVAQYVKSLNRVGYTVTEKQVVTPAVGVAQYLLSHGFQGQTHVLGSDPFRQDLIAAGVQCTEATYQKWLTLEETKKHLRNLHPNISAFVLDYAPRLCYMHLLEATSLLKRPDCAFVVGATDHDVPVDDICLLGPGYFVDMLRAASGREPVVAGKPSTVVRDVIASRHPEFDPRRTLFIGDSMTQDVQQGHLGGFTTLLVLSGVSKMADVEKASPQDQPHFVAPSLRALVPTLQRLAAFRAK